MTVIYIHPQPYEGKREYYEQPYSPFDDIHQASTGDFVVYVESIS